MSYQNVVPLEQRKFIREFWNDEDFNKEMRELVDIEMKSLEKGDVDGVQPKLLVICSKDGKPNGELERAIVVIAGGEEFNDSDTKYKIFQGLGAKFADEGFNVLCVYQITEAWVSQRTEKDMEGKFVPPSQDPNRGEAIIVAGMTIDGRTNMSSVLFKRIGDGDKKVIFPMSPNYIDYDEKGGNTLESYLMEQFFIFYIKAMAFKSLKKMGIKPEDFMKVAEVLRNKEQDGKKVVN